MQAIDGKIQPEKIAYSSRGGIVDFSRIDNIIYNEFIEPALSGENYIRLIKKAYQLDVNIEMLFEYYNIFKIVSSVSTPSGKIFSNIHAIPWGVIRKLYDFSSFAVMLLNKCECRSSLAVSFVLEKKFTFDHIELRAPTLNTEHMDLMLRTKYYCIRKVIKTLFKSINIGGVNVIGDIKYEIKTDNYFFLLLMGLSDKFIEQNFKSPVINNRGESICSRLALEYLTQDEDYKWLASKVSLIEELDMKTKYTIEQFESESYFDYGNNEVYNESGIVKQKKTDKKLNVLDLPVVSNVTFEWSAMKFTQKYVLLFKHEQYNYKITFCQPGKPDQVWRPFTRGNKLITTSSKINIFSMSVDCLPGSIEIEDNEYIAELIDNGFVLQYI